MKRNSEPVQKFRQDQYRYDYPKLLRKGLPVLNDLQVISKLTSIARPSYHPSQQYI
jgi:hypothetical protein